MSNFEQKVTTAAGWALKVTILPMLLLSLLVLSVGTPVWGTAARNDELLLELPRVRAKAINVTLPEAGELAAEMSDLSLTVDQITALFREHRRVVSPARLIKLFPRELTLRQLASVISIQGEREAERLIAGAGIPSASLDALCGEASGSSAVVVAYALTDGRADGPLSELHDSLASVWSEYSPELQTLVARASVEALALGCLKTHLAG